MTPPLDLTKASDQQLVKMARRGREDASAEIFRRYRRRILGFIHRMVGQRERARDLTQDTFVKVFEQLHRYRPEQEFAPWIFRIAQRKALDYLDARRLDSPTSPYAVTPGHIDRAAVADGAAIVDRTAIALVDRSDTPTPLPHAPELVSMVARALELLRPEHRRCIVQRYVQGLTYHEMAEEMSLPVGTVKSHTFRARKQLRANLRAQGVQWPGPLAHLRNDPGRRVSLTTS